MDLFTRLEKIPQEIYQVEEEKLQCEHLFWEHPPALDPEAVGRAMQLIRDRIRRQGPILLDEQRELIVRALTH